MAKRRDSDLLRAAHALSDLYGDRAAEVAERRAANSNTGKLDSAAPTWLRIAGTVRSLQASARRAGR